MLQQTKMLTAICAVFAFAAIPGSAGITDTGVLIPKYYIFFSFIVFVAGLTQVWHMRAITISNHGSGKQLFSLQSIFQSEISLSGT